MNKTFLFSPLGGTDPISQDNYKDGSMLHICRFEKPDKVFLYLSKEMVGYEKEDHRYTYCLDKLMALQGRKFEYVLDQHPELVDVYDYDYFYREFSSAINQIMLEEMDETDTLILNISSGTPAMKSALAVMQTISEYPCRMYQGKQRISLHCQTAPRSFPAHNEPAHHPRKSCGERVSRAYISAHPEGQ